MRYKYLLLILAGLWLGGCSSNDKKEEADTPEVNLYNLAQSRISSRNYTGAAEALFRIERSYPFGVYAEQARADLIYVHYMTGNFDASYAAAEKFIRLYPRNTNIDYAYFMKGMTGYYSDDGLFSDFLTLNLAKRDVTGAKKSFADLTEFLIRYPESDYVDEARSRLVFLRNLIASNELDSAEYYLKRGAYVAALNRATYIIKNMPNTSEKKRALKIMREAYTKLGYDDYAEKVKALEEVN